MKIAASAALWLLFPASTIFPSIAQPMQAGSPPMVQQPVTADAGAPEKPLHVGGSVKPPKLIDGLSPEYTDEARKKKVNGAVEIYCWVEPDGTTSHVRIVKGLGFGLDEQAEKAVSSYRFEPATMNGKPVRVELYVEVNFRMRKKFLGF